MRKPDEEVYLVGLEWQKTRHNSDHLFLNLHFNILKESGIFFVVIIIIIFISPLKRYTKKCTKDQRRKCQKEKIIEKRKLIKYCKRICTYKLFCIQVRLKNNI